MKIFSRGFAAVQSDTIIVLASPQCTYEPGSTPGSVIQTNAQCAFVALQGAGTPSFSNAYIYRPSDTTQRWMRVYENACHTIPAPFPSGDSWDDAATPWEGSPYLFAQSGVANNNTLLPCLLGATIAARASEAAAVASEIYSSYVMGAVILSVVGSMVGVFLVHKAAFAQPLHNISEDIELVRSGEDAAPARPHACVIDSLRFPAAMVSPFLGMLSGMAVGCIYPENTSNLYRWGLFGGMLGGPALAGALAWADLV